MMSALEKHIADLRWQLVGSTTGWEHRRRELLLTTRGGRNGVMRLHAGCAFLAMEWRAHACDFLFVLNFTFLVSKVVLLPWEQHESDFRKFRESALP